MHIWFLTQFYPPEVGAAAVRLERLARLLAADGHTVTVLTSMPNYPEGIIHPKYRGHLFYREQVNGVHIRRVWVYATPRKSTARRLLNQMSFMVMALLRGAFLRRPDVILVESHPLFICLSGGVLRRLKRVPVVLNVSDLWPESAVATGALRAESRMVKLAARVERWAYHDAAQIVGLTEGVVTGIRSVCRDSKPVTLIHNAVDLALFRPDSQAERDDARKRLGLEGKFVVSHIGNMSLTYDFEVMLRAAAALPEMVFLFAGGGSQFEAVKQQTEAQALKNVVFTGVLPHREMPKIWAASDVSLIALRDHSVAGGTLPAKMYEALASGVPVVAAIRGEGEAMLKAAGAGVVVPIGDQAALSAALRQLADEPSTRQRLAKAGRAYAEAHFAPERVKQAYFEILQEVVQKRF